MVEIHIHSYVYSIHVKCLFLFTVCVYGLPSLENTSVTNYRRHVSFRFAFLSLALTSHFSFVWSFKVQPLQKQQDVDNKGLSADCVRTPSMH